MKYESYTGATITYDSTVKAYEITTTNDNAKLLPIPILKNKDNFTLTVDIMGIDMKIMGIGYMSTEGTGKCYGSYNGYTFAFNEYNNNSWNESSNSGGSYSDNVWYTVKLIKTGTTLKFSVVYSSNTVLNSATLTNITSNYIGICFGYTPSTSSYFRNVKAY